MYRMDAAFSLISLNQYLQEITEFEHKYNQVYPSSSTASSSSDYSWMWNPSQVQEENDGSWDWEVRAFAEDTGNILGATWPPRSYTCTFCRREFRSAQALGGHMNVHRKDRARLHQSALPQPTPPSSSSSNYGFSTNNGGFGLLYQLPHPSDSISSNNVNDPIFTPATVNASVDSTSTFVTSSPHHNSTSNTEIFACAQSVNAPDLQLQLQSREIHCSYRRSMVVGSSSNGGNSDGNNDKCNKSETEEIDLELRL